jgi:hypothetical protein
VKRILWAIALLTVAACRKETPAVPDASTAAVPVVRPAESAMTLTPEMVDAYLRYQRAAVLGPGSGTDAGGTYDRAARDESALKASGLTDAQVTFIDELISAVVARRMVTQLAANPEFLPDMNAMQNTLNDEQKKRMAEAMAAFKQQQNDAKDLTEERKRYGSKNVDVLLSREAELTKVWSEMMGLGQLPGH